MTASPHPRIRQALQFIQHDEMNGELQVISSDEAASLLWAAQWLDEHREYFVTAIELKYPPADEVDDDDDSTSTLVVILHLANEHVPGCRGDMMAA